MGGSKTLSLRTRPRSLWTRVQIGRAVVSRSRLSAVAPEFYDDVCRLGRALKDELANFNREGCKAQVGHSSRTLPC